MCMAGKVWAAQWRSSGPYVCSGGTKHLALLSQLLAAWKGSSDHGFQFSSPNRDKAVGSHNKWLKAQKETAGSSEWGHAPVRRSSA